MTNYKVITINDWTGGLYDNYYKAGDVNTAKRMKDNEYANGVFDPISQPGTLNPVAIKKTDLVNYTIVDNPFWKIVGYSAGSDKVYALERGANIHEITVVTNTLTSPVFATIVAAGVHAGHSGFTGEDLVIYSKNGEICLFASWNDDTDGDLAQIAMDGTITSDYLSGTATGGAALGKNPHPLQIADNGFLYIGDGNSIHKLDGTVVGGANGTFTASAIDAPIGWVFNDFSKWEGYMLAVANFAPGGGDSLSTTTTKEKAMFIWDYLSSAGGDLDGFERVVPITGNGVVKYVFMHNGIPHIFLVAAGYSEIQRFNGSGFDFVKRLRSGDEPYCKGAISSFYGLTLWVSKSNGIFVFGSIYPNETDKIYRFGVPSGGAIMQATTAGSYYFGNGDDKAYVLLIPGGDNDNISDGAYGTGSIYYSRVYEVPFGSEIHGFNIYFEPTDKQTNTNSVNKLYVWINIPSGGVPTEEIQINIVENQEKGFIYIPYHKSNVYAIQIGYGFSTFSSDTKRASINPNRIEILWTNKLKKI